MSKMKDKKITDEEGFAAIPEPEPSQAVVVPDQNRAVATTGNGRGFEDMDQTDLIIPRAKCLQPTAEELTNMDCTLRAGQIINSLTKEPVPAFFLPLMAYKEYLRFNARNKDDAGFNDEYAPGALMWRTRDPNDTRVKEQCSFGPNGEHPLALTTLNFLSLFDGDSMPIIVSFSKTSYKAGQKLLSLSRFKGGDMWSHRYKLIAKSIKNDKGNYFILDVDNAGPCPADMLATAEGMFKSLSVKRESIQTHMDAD